MTTTRLGAEPRSDARLLVEYEGQTHVVPPGGPFDIGRDADLSLDRNPYLHRRLLRLQYEQGFWWLVNIGGGVGATLFDARTGMQAWLGPSARLPLIFGRVEVVFTAGPCTYQLALVNEEPAWQDGTYPTDVSGDTTIGAVGWTPAQKVVVLALAEPMLRREGFGVVHIPSNAEAASRIGWTTKRFERKIDNVCSKLDLLGVDGLRGGINQHASGRRARLVEWAISTGFVTAADLGMLDAELDLADDDDWS
jgi:hypothetical protein